MPKLSLDSVHTHRGKTDQVFTVTTMDGTVTVETTQGHGDCKIYGPGILIDVAGRLLPAANIVDVALVMGDLCEEGDEVDLDRKWLDRAVKAGLKGA